MKKVIFGLVAALVMCACGGNSEKKSEEAPAPVAEVAETEEDSVAKLYSTAYDGYTNIRQSASSKSKLLGTIRNGNDYVVLVGVEGNWYKVEYNGQTGYVHKDHVGETPVEPVTVDVDANWVDGCWVDEDHPYDGHHIYYCIYSNGKFTEYHEYESEYGILCHGQWYFEGNQIVLSTIYVTEGGRDFGVKRGNVETYKIDKSGRKLGRMTKVNISASYENRGYHCVDKEMFNDFKSEANKYVSNTPVVRSNVNSEPQGTRTNQRRRANDSADDYDDYDDDADYEDDADYADDDRQTKKGGSEDWDAVLTSYEEYVDQYISFAKKAAKGDLTALAKYPSLMEKAEELSDKLDHAEDEMTAAQVARYHKITRKLANAAEELDD